MVEVYDADAYLGDDAALKASERQVVAGNGYHLYLRSLQADIQVTVTIRIWPSEQQPPAEADGTTAVTLESETGLLVIRQPTYGPAGEMELPEPGVYEGYAWWTGRESTGAYYNDALARIGEDWTIEQIGQGWDDCPFEEIYTLDLHFVRPSEDVDEDD
ncbi:hypothetical protein [Streptomyces cucumeris]|uniref:hypothetical protein n=1 Tax=Streptomyces cucumeris TaxID=2962890 RepID=UPI003D71EA73